VNGKQQATSENATTVAAEDVDPIVQGLASVQNLLKRFDEGKEKDETRIKLRPSERFLSDSDLDEDAIEDDFRASLTGKNDFLKYTVPQYELKEKLYQMHCTTIDSLSNAEIVDLFNDVLPDLRKIKNGELPSKRHEIFKGIGLCKQSLRDLTVSEPFNTYRDTQVMNLIGDRLFGGLKDLTDNNGEYLHYISTVLVPEALVRIFAKANGIPIDLAEKEMRFQAGYDGELPADVIDRIPPDGDDED